MNQNTIRPVIEVYEENASFWAQERSKTKFLEKKFMEWILGHLSPGDQLLDLGCGSGFPIASFFLDKGIKVTGLDAASAMIKIANEDLPQGDWFVTDMRTLSLGRKFQAIIAWDSFFHLNFSEQEKMFPLFKDHLTKQGLLVFTSGPERGEAIGDMNGNQLFHASLSPEEYRALLEKNKFEVIKYYTRDESNADRNIWLCQLSR